MYVCVFVWMDVTLVDGTVVRAKDVTGASTKGRKVLELMDSFISYYLLINISMIPQLLYYFSTYLLFLDVCIISPRF